MKIFTGVQMHELDKFTIEHEPISSIDLMERAATKLTEAITGIWNRNTRIVVFAGPGNNGGDALAVARMLAERGYDVDAILFNTTGRLSEDCKINCERLHNTPALKSFIEVSQSFDPPKLEKDMLVVDGLFGSGLNKPLAGGFASVVKYINAAKVQVVSIDVPSGMMTESNTYNFRPNIIKADVTLTLDSKKLCMMFADMQELLGEVHVLDIGLSREYIANTNTQYEIVDEETVKSLMIKRDKFAHKGSMGHAMLMAGSSGMAGAAILAARSCLRSGVGKLTIVTPRCNQTILQLAVPEAILNIDVDDIAVTRAVDASSFNAIGIGPGLGTDELTSQALMSQVRNSSIPMVLDADALNTIASHRNMMMQLPQGVILTPHPKELDRLTGNDMGDDYERLTRACDIAQHLKCFIILKGHHSALCLPDGRVLFNSTGNAGMATAGSGDVLTGIITGLLTRGYSAEHAATVGMYVHGLAGDFAAEELGEESLLASDIVAYLPKAFKALYRGVL